jgi:hypothetical protein
MTLTAQFVSKIELGRSIATIHYNFPLRNPSENSDSLFARTAVWKMAHKVSVALK